MKSVIFRVVFLLLLCMSCLGAFHLHKQRHFDTKKSAFVAKNQAATEKILKETPVATQSHERSLSDYPSVSEKIVQPSRK